MKAASKAEWSTERLDGQEPKKAREHHLPVLTGLQFQKNIATLARKLLPNCVVEPLKVRWIILQLSLRAF